MTRKAARTLTERLAGAGVRSDDQPLMTWRRLRQIEGRHTTIIDLYRLVAEPRGLQPHELPLQERQALARSAMPFVWPEFAITVGSDRSDPIAVVQYDVQWPARFAAWRALIAEHLGPTARRIEHVGSTAVPGLAAKPTVDIQVSVGDMADEKCYVPALEEAGLQLRSRDDLHRYFRPFPGRPRDVHVHVCDLGSAWEREHLLFRDYLRVHDDARDAYARAKRAAALVWNDDGWGYTDAKSDIILAILAAAEEWAAAAG
jgi:GrpB-like predicted nucleotidyltransferase (UPF0157 family)